jgi:anti-sigma factor RsiW
VSKISEHIPFTRLVDLVEGRLTSGEQIEMRQHLLACPVCAAEVAWLDRVIGLMRADTAEQPPAHAVAAAKRLLRPPTQSAGHAARQQLMAMLQFDSARTPVALGRRAGAQTERQLLFAVSSYLLDLRFAPHGALWVVSGQLLGADDGRQVELDGPAGTTRVALNDLSEFALPPSPAGNYTLRLQLTDLDITIVGLEVGVYSEPTPDVHGSDDRR